MTTNMLDQSDKMRAVAKLLAQSADAMADARNAAMAANPPGMTSGQFAQCVLRENLMRDAVNKILLDSIDATLQGVQGAQADLEQAIQDANAKIQKVAGILKALSLFASLVGLAEAIVGADPVAILTAFDGVKSAVTAA